MTDLVHGWRFWKGLTDDPPGLVSLGLFPPPKTTTSVVCFDSTFSAPRCAQCAGGFRPKCERWCGVCAFWTLEQSLRSPVELTAVITPVVAARPVYWSPFDPRGTAWRAPRVAIRGIIVTDARAAAAKRVGERLDVPVWSDKSLRFVGRDDDIGIRRAVDFADELGLPNARPSAISGVTPEGPTSWNGIPGTTHRRGSEAKGLDQLARIDGLDRSGMSYERLRVEVLEAFPQYGETSEEARVRLNRAALLAGILPTHQA